MNIHSQLKVRFLFEVTPLLDKEFDEGQMSIVKNTINFQDDQFDQSPYIMGFNEKIESIKK